MSAMTPRETVHELDKHIIGQHEAKRSVAIALRNRWRRMQLNDAMRREITPKNILMIGPTGVGKTEIARRVARLVDAPFIKVEATKFTEVGYVGRDVESIIRDLVDMAIKMLKEKEIASVKNQAARNAEERILDALENRARSDDEQPQDSAARMMLRKRLVAGDLDDKEIEIELPQTTVGVEIMAPPGMEEMSNQLQSLLSNMSNSRKKKQKVKVKVALKQLCEEEAARLINEDEIRSKAIELTEQNGIVFIDEIDKVCRSHKNANADISRDGVQRDLLPLIEGSTVTTKYGLIKTDHILFIASGAFHLAKPSDLIPELQGRLPIRVSLNALTPNDFERILTEPDYSLTEQYCSLLKTEGVELHFTKDGIAKIAQTAWHVNENTENIGARRLHTVMERLLDQISFDATDYAINDNVISIDADYVQKHVGELVKDNDLSRYIL